MKFDRLLQEIMQNLLFEDNESTVVIVPGSFKPPHRGHYEMVKQYSDKYPQANIRVLISKPDPQAEKDQQRYTKDGKVVTPEAAKEIFELYVKHLNNVTVEISPVPSPMTATYMELEELKPNTNVILGASTKDNDWKRWSNTSRWVAQNNLPINIIDPKSTAVTAFGVGGRNYSASNIRDNFDNFDLIKQDLPDHINPEDVKNIFD